jgi:hypothetical protein
MAIFAGAKSNKEYEKPETGMYHGILADIVDLGNVTTQFKGEVKVQHMVRYVWVLNVLGKDKERFPETFGKQLTAQQRFNLSLHEKANMYKTVKQILNAPPPVQDGVEFDIELLLGSVRKIFILQEPSEDGKKMYANVQGISAADKGVVVTLPAGFQRAKDRPDNRGTRGTTSVNSTYTAGAAAEAARQAPADVSFGAVNAVSDDSEIPF